MRAWVAGACEYGQRPEGDKRVRAAGGDGRFERECVNLKKCWSKRQRVYAALGIMSKASDCSGRVTRQFARAAGSKARPATLGRMHSLAK